MIHYLTGRTIFLFILLCIIGYKTYQWHKNRTKNPALFEESVKAAFKSSNYQSCRDCLKVNYQSKEDAYQCIKYDTYCYKQNNAMVDYANGKCQVSLPDRLEKRKIKIVNTNGQWYCDGEAEGVARVPAPSCPSITQTKNNYPIISQFCPLTTTDSFPKNQWKECHIIQRNNISPIGISKFKIQRKDGNDWNIKNIDGSPFLTGLTARSTYRFTNCQFASEVLVEFPRFKTSEFQWCNIEYYAGKSCEGQLGHQMTGYMNTCLTPIDVWNKIKPTGDDKWAIWC